jgi:hypothetical protein
MYQAEPRCGRLTPRTPAGGDSQAPPISGPRGSAGFDCRLGHALASFVADHNLSFPEAGSKTPSDLRMRSV